MSKARFSMDRRSFIGAAGASVLGAPLFAQQASVPSTGTVEIERDISQAVRRNISSFRTLDWRPYFSNTRNGAILVDISSRALHYWSEDQKHLQAVPVIGSADTGSDAQGAHVGRAQGRGSDMASDAVDEEAKP